LTSQDITQGPRDACQVTFILPQAAGESLLREIRKALAPLVGREHDVFHGKEHERFSVKKDHDVPGTWKLSRTSKYRI